MNHKIYFGSLAKITLAFFGLISSLSVCASNADLSDVQTVEQYNSALVDYGVAWKASGSVYFPSLYTGFAPKEEVPERIHLHLSRGNQARLTVILDEQAVLTYLYSLRARSQFIQSAISKKWITPVQQLQVNAFINIVDHSSEYSINNVISQYDSGQISKAGLYNKSLSIMKQLNPGRIFQLNFNFANQIQNWRQNQLRKVASKISSNSKALETYFKQNPNVALTLANNMLFGRINAFALSAQQTQLLAALTANSQNNIDESDLQKAKELFLQLTENKYQISSAHSGQMQPAFDCQNLQHCQLSYPEFTAIYPVGSVKDYTSDRDGNTIPRIREVGGLHFIERDYHDVDHVRSESFYGWAPKMDYTNEGNAIHNPAVRTYLKKSIYAWLYDALHIPKNFDTYWIVSRGGVSHGCTRMAAGHILEVRQVFPSNPAVMTRLLYYGNAASDYDLFDIDGSGELRIMGVDYLLAYALASDSGDGYREANGLIEQSLKKDEFYNFLYGSKNQFYKNQETYIFTNPYITYFIGNPLNTRAKAYSIQMSGDFKLYEQAYEKDKLQFINIKTGISSLTKNNNNKTNISAQLVRIFGRINACGPFANDFKDTCYEQNFINEAKQLETGLQ